MASRALESWGDLAIHEDPGPRHLVAEAVSQRLTLSTTYVKDRIDQLHRIAPYEEGRERNSQHLEGEDRV